MLAKPLWADDERASIVELLESYLDWSKVIGLLQYHRISGIAYRNLNLYFSEEAIKFSYEKFLSMLYQSYIMQKNKTQEQWEYTNRVCKALNEDGIDYVMLKGIILSSCVYEDLGARNFGDTDILIHSSQINKAMQCLLKLGYVQGKMLMGEEDIIKSSRKDTMLWSLISHEVHPFVLKTPDCSLIRYHDVDLQFSLDLNTGNRTDNAVHDLIACSSSVTIGDVTVKTLGWEDFLVFLCIHYYKEVTTLKEVTSYNDIVLYKLCDIYYLIANKNIKLNWEKVVYKAEFTQSTKGVYYTLLNLCQIYGEVVPVELLNQVKPQDLSYLDEVYHYNSNEVAATYKLSFIERLVHPNRPTILKFK
nr:nucleotidyltransferase family protein [Paenibacillus roseus]